MSYSQFHISFLSAGRCRIENDRGRRKKTKKKPTNKQTTRGSLKTTCIRVFLCQASFCKKKTHMYLQFNSPGVYDMEKCVRKRCLSNIETEMPSTQVLLLYIDRSPGAANWNITMRIWSPSGISYRLRLASNEVKMLKHLDNICFRSLSKYHKRWHLFGFRSFLLTAFSS